MSPRIVKSKVVPKRRYRSGKRIKRSELMLTMLRNDVDEDMRRKLSYVYDTILEKEEDSDIFMTSLKVSNREEKDVFDFIHACKASQL